MSHRSARLLALPVREFFAEIKGWEPAEIDDAMWARCRTDRALFCSAMFPARFPLRFNAMHRDFLSRPKVGWRLRKHGSKEADAAPREAAKA